MKSLVLFLAVLLPLHAEPVAAPLFNPDSVLSSRIIHQDGRQITLQKVVPMALPAPKPAPAASLVQPAAGRTWTDVKPRRMLQLGASVYLREGLPDETRTLIHYWATAGEAPIVLLSNANFLWLSSAFADFEAGGATYSLLMAISPARLSRLTDMTTLFQEQFPGKPLPVFTDFSTASFAIVEGNPTAEQLAPLQALLDHYNAHRPTLETRYLANQELARQRREEEAANPPELKPLVIRYWRSDPQGRKETTSTSFDNR